MTKEREILTQKKKSCLLLLLEFKIRKRRGKGLLLEFDYDQKNEREISEREEKNELWNKIGARSGHVLFY